MPNVVEEPAGQQVAPKAVIPPTVQTAMPVDETAEFAAAAERAFNDEPAEESPIQALSTELLREFAEAEQLRLPTEEKWLKDIRQFRGQYEQDVLDTLTNRSKSFVRRTRVKVNTTDARMMDYLFPAGQEKNWTCDSTPKPSVSDKTKAAIAQRLAQSKGGQPPSEQDVEDAVVSMCKEAAKGMTKVIDDQLTEIRYKQVTRKALHSGNLYGTGILKGPLVEKKVRQRFEETVDAANNQAKWQSKNEEYLVPFVDHVPLWRFYPDMAGATELEQCRFAYELHRMTRHQFASLISRTTFKGEIIKAHIEANRAAPPRCEPSSRSCTSWASAKA
jgi:hypothetical protein